MNVVHGFLIKFRPQDLQLVCHRKNVLLQYILDLCIVQLLCSAGYTSVRMYQFVQVLNVKASEVWEIAKDAFGKFWIAAGLELREAFSPYDAQTAARCEFPFLSFASPGGSSSTS